MLIPLDAEVARAPTELFVVERPAEAEVESDAVLLALAVMPVDADVDSTPTELFVVDKPVESEPTPL